MNRRTMAVILISMSILAAGCGSNPQKTQAVNSMTKAADSVQKSSGAEVNNSSGTETESQSTDYTSYSGSWLLETSVKQDYIYGIGMSINVNKDGDVQGQIGNASDNASHIANVDIKGKIQNNKLSCNFSEDGWGHSGTVNLQFTGSKAIMTIKYKTSSSSDNLWGIGEGTFTLLKEDARVDRTLSDLQGGGLQLIDNQCFKTSINNFGNVKFISGYKREDGKQQAYFYLINDTDKVEYKFPHFYGNEKGSFSEIKAVSFADVNNDGLKDVIIIAGYKTDMASSNEISISSIYFQKGQEFIENKDFDDKLNNSSDNKSVKDVIKYAKENLNK